MGVKLNLLNLRLAAKYSAGRPTTLVTILMLQGEELNQESL